MAPPGSDDDDLEFITRPSRPKRRARPARTQQDRRLVARVLALASAAHSLAQIDRALHTEGYLNSKGAPWPLKSDGCVLRRIIEGHGIVVPSSSSTTTRSCTVKPALSSPNSKRLKIRATAPIRPVATNGRASIAHKPAAEAQVQKNVLHGERGQSLDDHNLAAKAKVQNDLLHCLRDDALDESALLGDEVLSRHAPDSNSRDDISGPVLHLDPTAEQTQSSRVVAPSVGGPPQAMDTQMPAPAASLAVSCSSAQPATLALAKPGRSPSQQATPNNMRDENAKPNDHNVVIPEVSTKQQFIDDESTSSQQDSPISRALRARRHRSDRGLRSPMSPPAKALSERTYHQAQATGVAQLPATASLQMGRHEVPHDSELDDAASVHKRDLHEANSHVSSKRVLPPSAHRTSQEYVCVTASPVVTHSEVPCLAPHQVLSTSSASHAELGQRMGSDSRVEMGSLSRPRDSSRGGPNSAPRDHFFIGVPGRPGASGASPLQSPIISSASSFEAPERAQYRWRRCGRRVGSNRTSTSNNQPSQQGNARADGPKRQRKQGSNTAETSRASDIMQDGSRCQMCSLPWHRSGSHQACTLPCGHLFGRSCIESELRRRAASTRERCECPICRSAAFIRQIRLVFVTSEAAADEAQLRRRQAELDAEVAKEEVLALRAAERRKAAEKNVANLRAQLAAVLAAQSAYA